MICQGTALFAIRPLSKKAPEIPVRGHPFLPLGDESRSESCMDFSIQIHLSFSVLFSGLVCYNNRKDL